MSHDIFHFLGYTFFNWIKIDPFLKKIDATSHDVGIDQFHKLYKGEGGV